MYSTCCPYTYSLGQVLASSCSSRRSLTTTEACDRLSPNHGLDLRQWVSLNLCQRGVELRALFKPHHQYQGRAISCDHRPSSRPSSSQALMRALVSERSWRYTAAGG